MKIYMNNEKMNAGDEATGKKPEHLTSLSGDRLVSKTHGRIAFRGRIDTLQAEVIEAQVLASQLGESEVLRDLGEILDYLRTLMAAEVKGTPLPPPFLFGLPADEIHRLSHECGGKLPPLPSCTQGPMAARLNTLRAKVREVELLAVKVFGPEDSTETREDIILALNRLSSALWRLYCEYISQNPSHEGPKDT